LLQFLADVHWLGDGAQHHCHVSLLNWRCT
jgi:hypothetical protein